MTKKVKIEFKLARVINLPTHIMPIGFHSKHIYAPVRKYGGEKIIFIMPEGRDKRSREHILDAVKQAKKLTGGLGIKSEFINLEGDYDLERVSGFFEKIFKKEKQLVVNLTGGPKFNSLCLYLAALKNYKKVLDIVYIREDIGELVSFPKFVSSGSLTDFERELLRTVKSEMSTSRLANKMKKPLPQITRYVKKLEKKGLLKAYKEGKERKIRTSFMF